MEKLAQTMFNAYNEHGPHPWKTFDGRDVPKWDGLNDEVRAKWTAAAYAARAGWQRALERTLAELT